MYMYYEAGNLPFLATLLGGALELYSNKREGKFSIIPRARLISNNDRLCYIYIVVVEVSFCCALERHIVVYKLVSCAFSTIPICPFFKNFSFTCLFCVHNLHEYRLLL